MLRVMIESPSRIQNNKEVIQDATTDVYFIDCHGGLFKLSTDQILLV